MSKENPKLNPVPNTPMCEVARRCEYLKERLQHYKLCSDPRCIARKNAYIKVIKALKEGR